MKRISMALLAIMLFVGIGQTAAQIRVVFVGDSITRIFNDCNADWFAENNFSRHGYDGRTTSWMLKGFKEGVLDKNPQCIVIGAGTNDIAQNDGVFVSVDHIYANIVSMVEQAQAAGIKVIMTTVMPSEKYWFAPASVGTVANIIPRLNNKLEEYAGTHNCGWVDYYSMFATETGKFDERWSYDDCHPHDKKLSTTHVMRELVGSAIDAMLNE
ncbi:MAG: acylhydrolase [Rikenellaceae bacterium]|nr:acylhydrolase [Rikenellaceae bacterium]